MTLNIFVLDPNEITIWAEVEYQSTADDDSTPSSYFPTLGMPLEDDEDMLTLSSGPTSMPLVAGQSSNNSLPNAAFLIEKVYPNPTTDVLNVELEIGAESDAILQIANVQGATIEQFDFNLEKGKNNLRIEVATLARGVYFLKIETESGVMIERFLKE